MSVGSAPARRGRAAHPLRRTGPDGSRRPTLRRLGDLEDLRGVRLGGGVAEESEDPWLCGPGFCRVCSCQGWSPNCAPRYDDVLLLSRGRSTLRRARCRVAPPSCHPSGRHRTLSHSSQHPNGSRRVLDGPVALQRGEKQFRDARITDPPPRAHRMRNAPHGKDLRGELLVHRCLTELLPRRGGSARTQSGASYGPLTTHPLRLPLQINLLRARPANLSGSDWPDRSARTCYAG
jgi:hypothetical protein